MTQIVLAPCSPFSVTTNLLKESAALARHYKVQLHTHLCETLDEERYTLERYQLRPVDWMETLGWLGDDVWFAHAIHVDDDEIQKIGRDRCGAAHCPCSNMRLGLRHRAGQEVHGRRREGRAGRRRLGQQQLLEHPDGGAPGDVAGAPAARPVPPEGPRKHMFLSQSHPVRAHEWMTAREALELATMRRRAGARDATTSARSNPASAPTFLPRLDTVAYAGGLHDPVAAGAVLRAAASPTHGDQRPGRGRNGEIVTMDMRPVIATHNRCAAKLLEA